MALVGSEISAVKMSFSTVFWTLDYSHNNLYKQLLFPAGMRGKYVCHSCIITAFSTLHVVERLLLNFGNSVQLAIVPCGNNHERLLRWSLFNRKLFTLSLLKGLVVVFLANVKKATSGTARVCNGWSPMKEPPFQLVVDKKMSLSLLLPLLLNY